MIWSLSTILLVSIPLLYYIQETSVEFQTETNLVGERESLKEVVYSQTSCAVHWRSELFDMWDDINHDYKNDPIYIECLDALISQKSLERLEFDKWSGAGDIHYERVDNEKKYWATLKDIKLNDDDSIQVEFSGNGFTTSSVNTELPEVTYSVPDFRLVTSINNGAEFVALCTETDERQIHVLKYAGITQKDKVDYFTFWHKSTTIPLEELPKCQYPAIIWDSKSVDFDLGEKPTSSVWDHDWK